MLIENGENIFLNSRQEFKQVFMDNLAWVEHCYQNFMLNSHKFLENINFFVNKDVLQENYIVAVLALVVLFKTLHFIHVNFATMLKMIAYFKRSGFGLIHSYPSYPSLVNVYLTSLWLINLSLSNYR